MAASASNMSQNTVQVRHRVISISAEAFYITMKRDRATYDRDIR